MIAKQYQKDIELTIMGEKIHFLKYSFLPDSSVTFDGNSFAAILQSTIIKTEVKVGTIRVMGGLTEVVFLEV